MPKKPTKVAKPEKPTSRTRPISDRSVKKADKPRWAASEITHQRAADLIPSANNVVLHSEANVAKLAASLRKFGWAMPVLVDEGNVLVAGHGRVMAALEVGGDHAEYVPTICARGWSEQDIEAFRIADNALARDSTWDTGKLIASLKGLAAESYDLPVIGFDQGFYDSVMGEHEIDDGDIVIPGGGPITNPVQSSNSNRGSGDKFEPNLEPERGGTDVTSQDLEKAADKLLAKPGDMARQDLVEVTCPHCAETFDVDRKSLA